MTRRVPDASLVTRSGRGSQYASEHSLRLLERHGISYCMSRRGDCRDNVPIETFFASLKKQLVLGAAQCETAGSSTRLMRPGSWKTRWLAFA